MRLHTQVRTESEECETLTRFALWWANIGGIPFNNDRFALWWRSGQWHKTCLYPAPCQWHGEGSGHIRTSLMTLWGLDKILLGKRLQLMFRWPLWISGLSQESSLRNLFHFTRCFDSQKDIQPSFQGKVGQIRSSQDDIRVWSWTTAEEYGQDKGISSWTGNGPWVGCPEHATNKVPQEVLIMLRKSWTCYHNSCSGSTTDLGYVAKTLLWQTLPGL